jgi:hypothetical protein
MVLEQSRIAWHAMQAARGAEPPEKVVAGENHCGDITSAAAA